MYILLIIYRHVCFSSFAALSMNYSLWAHRPIEIMQEAFKRGMFRGPNCFHYPIEINTVVYALSERFCLWTVVCMCFELLVCSHEIKLWTFLSFEKFWSRGQPASSLCPLFTANKPCFRGYIFFYCTYNKIVFAMIYSHLINPAIL